MGTLLPPHHQNRALALLFLHFRRRVRKEKLCAEQGRDACLEMPKLGNKSGHVGFLSSGGSPQNLMACPGQVRRPQGVPRSPCKARVVRVDVEEKSPGSEIGRFGTGMKGGGKKGRLRRPGRPRRWAHVFNRSRGQQGLARKAVEGGGASAHRAQSVPSMGTLTCSSLSLRGPSPPLPLHIKRCSEAYPARFQAVQDSLRRKLWL